MVRVAREAERLLAGTSWLPEPLRTPDGQVAEADGDTGADSMPAFLADGEEDGAGDPTASDPEEAQPHAVAAE